MARKFQVTHGESFRGAVTAEYKIWLSIKARCHSTCVHKKDYHQKNGIKVCKRWRYSYKNFLADMGRRPTKNHQLDRINNNGDYKPSNCRWATRKEQARNMNKNVWVVIKGKKMILKDALKHLKYHGASFYIIKKRNNFTHQKTINYIIKNRKK